MSLNYLTNQLEKTDLNCRCNNLVVDGDLTINSTNAFSFTPTIVVTGGTTSYSLQRGRYTKIGKMYIITLHIRFTTTGTGDLTIKTNIPGFSFLDINLPQTGLCIRGGALPNFAVGCIGIHASSIQNTDQMTIYQEFIDADSLALPTPSTTACDFKVNITAFSN